jgi:hypothetical protein
MLVSDKKKYFFKNKKMLIFLKKKRKKMKKSKGITGEKWTYEFVNGLNCEAKRRAISAVQRSYK